MVVLATFISVIDKKKEKLERVFCIWYLVIFKDQIKALLDSRSEVNAMSQVFAH